jgi:hypothetical protein
MASAAALALHLAAPAAWAHGAADNRGLEVPSAVALGLVAAGALATALAAAGRRARLALLVLAVLVLGAETSVHAVHHPEGPTAAACVVALATSHLHGNPAAPTTVETASLPGIGPAPAPSAVPLPRPPRVPRESRAPPVLPA